MLEVTIELCSKPLYEHYKGQTAQQPVFLHLNCETGSLSCYCSDNISPGCPINIYNRTAVRWRIPPLQPDTTNELMTKVKDSAQDILNGYAPGWNGNNIVGTFTEEAERAKEWIEAVCSNLICDYQIWDAAEFWLNAYSYASICKELNITDNTTKSDIIQQIQDDLKKYPEVHALTNIDTFAQQILDYYASNK